MAFRHDDRGGMVEWSRTKVKERYIGPTIHLSQGVQARLSWGSRLRGLEALKCMKARRTLPRIDLGVSVESSTLFETEPLMSERMLMRATSRVDVRDKS